VEAVEYLCNRYGFSRRLYMSVLASGLPSKPRKADESRNLGVKSHKNEANGGVDPERGLNGRTKQFEGPEQNGTGVQGRGTFGLRDLIKETADYISFDISRNCKQPSRLPARSCRC
jgi:hypothetical protein